MAKPVAVFTEIEAVEQGLYQSRLPELDVWHTEAPLTPEADDAALLCQLGEAEVLSVMVKSRVTKSVLDKMPNLRLIAARSTGFDHIDREEATRRDIRVVTVPEYGSSTVAEYTFALLLNLSRSVHRAYLRALLGDFTNAGLMGMDLAGKTLGIVGLGKIGRHVARIAQGFSMRVCAFDAYLTPAEAKKIGVELEDFNSLLARSDAVAICCPLTAETRHLFDERAFSCMKPGALLVNTARGPIIETQALVRALGRGQVGGAALDVLEDENCLEESAAIAAAGEGAAEILAQNLTLMRHPNVIATPHMAYLSREAIGRIQDTTVANIQAHLRESSNRETALSVSH